MADLSLRTRLKTAFIGLAVVPLLLMGMILIWLSHDVEMEQALELQDEISRRVAAQIDAYLHLVEHELNLAARINPIMDMAPAAQREVVSRLRSFHNPDHEELYEEAALMDKKGRVVALASRVNVYGNADMGNRSATDEFKTPFTKLETYYSPIRFDAKTGEPFLTIAVPIVAARSGRAIGVLSAVVRLRDIRGFISNLNIGKRGIAYVVDNNGVVVVHRNPSVVLKGTIFKLPSKPGAAIGLDGKKAVLGFTPLAVSGAVYHVVTERPAQEATALPMRIVIVTILVIIVSLAGVVSLAMLVNRKVLRPLELLADTAQSIENGDLERKAGHTGDYELDTLADAFNGMARRLISNITALQYHIRERDAANAALKKKTVALETINVRLEKEFVDKLAAQRALTDSHERLLAVLNSLDAAVYVADMKTHEILFANALVESLFGDVVGRTCWQALQSGQTGPCPFCTNDKLIDAHGQPTGAYKWEFRNTANGLWYAIHDRAIRWIDGRLVKLAISYDITERKNLEAEKLRSDKLAAMGTLAAGIAHEINNPLTNASLAIELLKDKLNCCGEKAGEILQKIMEVELSIDHAAAIAKELLHFSRQKELQLTETDVNKVIGAAIGFMRYKLDGVTLTKELARLPAVNADPGRLQQVFINILSNAADAMPNGGNIKITTTSSESHVTIIITDTGIGVAPGDTMRVFEPFFSTKEIGRGTGLGLSISYGIIIQHNGTIDLSSEQGKGTTITIKLPVRGKA
ncbi:MAG: HAMP domain-containing protein [Deltaproteobacteria bacterium]|nr:HAMP domain-containing protein [Deltaproteobacteria bacterium]